MEAQEGAGPHPGGEVLEVHAGQVQGGLHHVEGGDGAPIEIPQGGPGGHGDLQAREVRELQDGVPRGIHAGGVLGVQRGDIGAARAVGELVGLVDGQVRVLHQLL
jgi:hypothetical protein